MKKLAAATQGGDVAGRPGARGKEAHLQHTASRIDHGQGSAANRQAAKEAAAKEQQQEREVTRILYVERNAGGMRMQRFVVCVGWDRRVFVFSDDTSREVQGYQYCMPRSLDPYFQKGAAKSLGSLLNSSAMGWFDDNHPEGEAHSYGGYMNPFGGGRSRQSAGPGGGADDGGVRRLGSIRGGLWKACFSSKRQRTFYLNRLTNERSWHKPPGFEE